MSASSLRMVLALAQLGRQVTHGRGTLQQQAAVGLQLLRRQQAAHHSGHVAGHAPVPFDAGSAQAHADTAAGHYHPVRPPLDSAASEVPAPVLSGLSQLTGVDVAGQLGGLQQVAGGLLAATIDVLGIQSTGFSGGVDAQQAAYISAGGSIEEQQKRLLDVEGVSGTAQKFIGGDYVTVGGRGRGGPGWSEIIE